MSLIQMFLLAYNNSKLGMWAELGSVTPPPSSRAGGRAGSSSSSRAPWLPLVKVVLTSFSDDWKEIFGDFTKFGLGAISLSFDILFIFQHYIFYRNSVSYEPQNSVLDDDDDDEPAIVGEQQGSGSIHVPYVDADER